VILRNATLAFDSCGRLTKFNLFTAHVIYQVILLLAVSSDDEIKTATYNFWRICIRSGGRVANNPPNDNQRCFPAIYSHHLRHAHRHVFYSEEVQIESALIKRKERRRKKEVGTKQKYQYLAIAMLKSVI
jgi:hypothetical protein